MDEELAGTVDETGGEADVLDRIGAATEGVLAEAEPGEDFGEEEPAKSGAKPELSESERDFLQRGKRSWGMEQVDSALKKYPEATGKRDDIAGLVERLVRNGAGQDTIKERIYTEARRVDSLRRDIKAELREEMKSALAKEKETMGETPEATHDDMADNLGRPIAGAGSGSAVTAVDAINSAKNEKEVMEALRAAGVKTVNQ